MILLARTSKREISRLWTDFSVWCLNASISSSTGYDIIFAMGTNCRSLVIWRRIVMWISVVWPQGAPKVGFNEKLGWAQSDYSVLAIHSHETQHWIAYNIYLCFSVPVTVNVQTGQWLQWSKNITNNHHLSSCWFACPVYCCFPLLNNGILYFETITRRKLLQSFCSCIFFVFRLSSWSFPSFLMLSYIYFCFKFTRVKDRVNNPTQPLLNLIWKKHLFNGNRAS